MIKKLAVLCFVLCVSTALSTYAQTGKKFTKALKAASSFKQSAAYQRALRHAQALRGSTTKLQGKQVEHAVITASQANAARAGITSATKQELLEKLEIFIKEHGYFPHKDVLIEKGLYTFWQKAVKRNAQDPLSLRIRELRALYPKKRNARTTHSYLDELEKFIAKYGFFPRGHVLAERKLYIRLHSLMRRLGTEHPFSVRIQELKTRYQQKRGAFAAPVYLEELESFIDTHGYFPRAQGADEQSVYMKMRNLLADLDPQHPIALRIQQLRAQYRLHALKTEHGWLYELEDFVAANGRYPVLGNTLEENQLYLELDNLIKTLDLDNPVSVRINELRTQQALPPTVQPIDYTYQPQDEDLAIVQKYMHKNHNYWPEIVPMAGDALAARSLYLTVIKDHQGRLSPQDRQQLYNLFANNEVRSLQSIVAAYNRWKQAHSTAQPKMPTVANLKMEESNPLFSGWYPPLFNNMQEYLGWPWMWNTATLIYLGQKVYPYQLPAELMKIDVFPKRIVPKI